MTLLNIVSIVVCIVLCAVTVILWVKYRRHVKEGEGALAVLDAASETAEPPRDGMDDPPAPNIIYTNTNPVDRSQ